MDSIKLTVQNAERERSHHSDEMSFEIEPFGVEPEPVPIAAGVGLLLFAGLLLYAVTRKKGEEK